MPFISLGITSREEIKKKRKRRKRERKEKGNREKRREKEKEENEKGNYSEKACVHVYSEAHLCVKYHYILFCMLFFSILM